MSDQVPSRPISLAADDRMPERVVGPVTRTDLVRYAGAGGDFHPLHHDEEYARSQGYPSVFAMGLYHAGLLGNQLARWVGPDAIQSYQVRFSAQVWPGDLLTLSGEVAEIREVDGHRLADIRLRVVRPGGEEAISGKATVRVAAQSGDQ